MKTEKPLKKQQMNTILLKFKSERRVQVATKVKKELTERGQDGGKER